MIRKVTSVISNLLGENQAIIVSLIISHPENTQFKVKFRRQ